VIFNPLAPMNRSAASDKEKRRRVSALSRQIIFINFIALAILVAGVLFIQTRSAGLVDERMAGIKQEALIVAGALAEYATREEPFSVDDAKAEPLLRQLMAPTQLRARLYATNGRLIVDTRNLLARNVVETVELPSLDFWSSARGWVTRIYDGVTGIRPFTRLEPYFEAGDNGRVYSEVNAALQGDSAGAERVNEHNKLVLSVAAPVQKFKAIYGVLLLSTEGGDIDNILRQERISLIGVTLVALLVMVFLSLSLSGRIAQPVLQLAQAADKVRSGRSGRETIPSLAERNDEIGDLAESLSAMTKALYDRIDAIESFAADVAHELKNPLTSLKSAIEMFARAEDDATRTKLMAIVRNDLKRIDRLITDISDVSRLDAELSRESAEPVDIVHLLETIVEIYQATGLPRGVKLALTLDLPSGAQVMGRDERLGQIVRNLIDNALSFSPDGTTVNISASENKEMVQIAVEDHGPGIASENLEHIFDRFYTERPAAHGFGTNSGLGLSIARQIAEGVGGRIWAENAVGQQGARVIVELPLSGIAR
jgi:two-component system, OmpR family, sensor histidine kinase ChvG